MFKKKKIPSKKTNLKKILNVASTNSNNNSKFFWVIVWFFSIILIVLVWIWVTKQVSDVKFDLNTLIGLAWFEWTDFKTLEEKSPILKSPDGKTNVLIIGRWWEENDAPLLTDSILIASLNYNKKFISLFSVPRDLYVEYPTWWAWKINETYFRGYQKTWEEIDWINALKDVLKKITWEEIHYYANIDFEGFRKIIDSVWWIEVDVPESIVDTTYPWPNHSYQTFKIDAWLQTLDWSTALKYARSRHSTSDFDRSIRQQLIIKALKDKVLNLGFLSSPSKVKSLYTILKEYVTTDFDISQIIALAIYVKDLPRENMVTSNLNDSCFYGSSVCEKWWFLYVPLRADFGWSSVLLQNWWTKSNPSNYDDLVMYTNLVFNYPEIYEENMQINVFNSTWVWWLAQDVAESLKKYGFNIPAYNSIWNTAWDKYEKSKILYSTWTGWIKPATVEALELFIFGWSENVELLPKYSKEPGTQIEIIIWDDYNLLNF